VFSNIKDNITRNFLELKLWVNNISTKQQASDVVFYNINKGLFFVYAYGIFEECVREIIAATINALNAYSVPIDKCIFELYSLIFSPEYDSLYNVGTDHKWEKRWAIATKLQDNDNIFIQEDIFPTDGKNLRYKQIEMLSKSFGIKEPVLPRKEIGGYLDELVNNRNAIAHGNKLPKEVGRNYTIKDLNDRIAYISEIIIYICNLYESYIDEKQFLRQ